MTAPLNLLDWRARARRQRTRRQQRNTLALAALGLLLVAVLLAVLAPQVRLQQERRDAQQADHERLTSRLAQAREQRQARLALQARARQRLEWQAQRVAAVHWFVEIARALPPSARLQQVRWSGGELQLRGSLGSATSLPELTAALEASRWFADVQLRSLGDGSDAMPAFALSLQTRSWPESPATDPHARELPR